MSVIMQTPNKHRVQSINIEWDTTRGRGNFDAGYVNEFYFCNSESGEIDEQKKKQMEEDPQYKLIKNRRITSSSSNKKSNPKFQKKKSTASDSQVTKKAKNPRISKSRAQTTQTNSDNES